MIRTKKHNLRQSICRLYRAKPAEFCQGSSIESDFLAELAQIQAESIGWIPLEEGVYLHVSDENATEVLVVGVPQAGAAVLLVI